MPISNEIRRLSAKWQTGTGWPKRLEWLEIDEIRGWNRQRFDLRYPIMAVVGENGLGKSSLLQAAASVYRTPGKKPRFASDFFPDTAWEQIKRASIRYSFRQGNDSTVASIRKPGERWRGNPERPQRHVEYIDLSRIQPIAARIGYTKLVKSNHTEVSANLFDEARLNRFSEVMGRKYDFAKMALTNVDSHREVPVLSLQKNPYSGFHQGAGEIMVAELLRVDLPQYSIVLIDEIESSLHPRTQRRMIRDLADKCREREWQVILTTHSSFILSELPPEARAYIMQIGEERNIIYGVSPEFAMTKMDDVAQPECDLYVEDPRAQTMLTEILFERGQELVQRCQIIPYGAASVGQALGLMVSQGRFPRPSRVFLDGDQASAPGCISLPGDDAPERVVFEAIRSRGWHGISQRVGRAYSLVGDACSRAMAVGDHHEWVADAATKLSLTGDILWQAMCAEWSKYCLSKEDARIVTQSITDALIGLGPEPVAPATTAKQTEDNPPDPKTPGPKGEAKNRTPSSNNQSKLFEQ
jgi:predicted ATPase